MNDFDPSNVALPGAHGALVRRVIRAAGGRPDALLILGDYYAQLAEHLIANGFAQAALQARVCARRLRDAVRPVRTSTRGLRQSYLETLITQRSP